jgi:nucleoid-associated protein YgaU
MALNMKAALLVCLGIISGISYVLQQFTAPAMALASPLSIEHVALVAVPDSATRGTGRAGADGGWRVRAAQQLAQPSATAQRDAPSAVAATPLPIVTAAPPRVVEADPADVPALVYDPPEQPGAVLVADAQVVDDAADDAATPALAEAAPTDTPGRMKRYTVARGDSLARIARREWGSTDPRLIDLLVAANPQLEGRRHRILRGEPLRIPDQVVADRVLTGGGRRGADRMRLASTVADAPEIAQPQWYVVKRNDTLASIARRYLNDDKRWREIVEVNDKLNPNRIFPGMKIKLPPAIRIAAS